MIKNDHSKQTSFKAIDSDNSVNDFEKNDDEILSKNDNMINNKNK